MKKLLLIRHAKSSKDDPSLDDFDRPLNKRGRRNAPDMANRLKALGIRPDLMITSPAVRALVTCEEFALVLEFPVQKIIQESRLYLTEEEVYLEVIQSIGDEFNTVLLFGHNPGISDFASSLTGTDIVMPTCSISTLTLPVSEWKNVRRDQGRIISFDYPKSVIGK